MNRTMWIGLLALVIGAVVRSLKTGGATAILTRIAGRDIENGDEPLKIPPRLLPFVALAAGALAGGLDAYVSGASLEDALAAGAMAAATAVFGHELLSGVPGVKKVLSVGFVFIGVSLSTASCTPASRLALFDTFADMATCALANMNLPDEQILLRCGAKSLDDRERVLRIVGEGRSQAASQASSAYSRGIVDQMTASNPGFSGVPCSTPSDAGADSGGKP